MVNVWAYGVVVSLLLMYEAYGVVVSLLMYGLCVILLMYGPMV